LVPYYTAHEIHQDFFLYVIVGLLENQREHLALGGMLRSENYKYELFPSIGFFINETISYTSPTT